MKEETSNGSDLGRRGLQAFLSLLALVMLGASLQVLLGGADTVLDPGDVSRNIDSEMRFFAAWYLAAGIVLLRVIPDIQASGSVVLFVGSAFFIAACGRALSIIQVGRPHTFSVVLMVIEFVIPLVIIPWQRRLASAAGASVGDRSRER